MTTNKYNKSFKEKLSYSIIITLVIAFSCGMLQFSGFFYRLNEWGFCLSLVALFVEMLVWKVKFGVTRGFKWIVSFLLFVVLGGIWFLGVTVSLIFGGSEFYIPFFPYILFCLPPG